MKKVIVWLSDINILVFSATRRKQTITINVKEVFDDDPAFTQMIKWNAIPLLYYVTYKRTERLWRLKFFLVYTT